MAVLIRVEKEYGADSLWRTGEHAAAVIERWVVVETSDVLVADARVLCHRRYSLVSGVGWSWEGGIDLQINRPALH